MSPTKHTGIRVGSFWISLAAVLIAAMVAAGVATAGDPSNTVVGDAACGASGTCGTGEDDSAFGIDALDSNTTGMSNTAVGAYALEDNQTGSDNTAIGLFTLSRNSDGNENTATGVGALFVNDSGNDNTATGVSALAGNKTGVDNTATGDQALDKNSTGSENTATGYQALDNSTGIGNTAMGDGALLNLTSGDNNIAIGINAGRALATGSNNIDIGAGGIDGESNTTRIGMPTQTSAYIGGVFGVIGTRGGLPVLVGPQGHLFTQVSSVRFKRDVHDMGNASDKLMKLRPVTFRYRQDPDGTPQYGLIAEEVERVYPEMVVYDDKGQVEGIRYDQLPAMLLNHEQKLTAEIAAERQLNATQQEQIAAERQLNADQQREIESLKKNNAQIEALTDRIDALERQARLASPEHLASIMR